MFKNIFKKRKANKPTKFYNPINIVELDFSDRVGISCVIENISSSKIDGYVIKNVLSSADIEKIVSLFLNMSKSNNWKNFTSETYPTSLYSFLIFDDIKLEDVAQFDSELQNRITQELGYNLNTRIKEILEALNGEDEVTAKKIDKNRSSPFYQFRSITSQHISFLPHCENMHMIGREERNDQLGLYKIPMDVIPFFITLQSSENDGCLYIHDLIWNDTQVVKNADHIVHEVYDGLQNKTIDVNKIPKRKIELKPGDLFIFSGHSIWHSVTPVKGDSRRITAGGFLKKNGETNVWI